MSKQALRVAQFATGNVGSEMVRRIVEHPDLELVSLYCYSPEKVGRDAGEIVGIAPLGVVATGDIDDVIRAKPDVVNFNGVWPDVDLFCTASMSSPRPTGSPGTIATGTTRIRPARSRPSSSKLPASAGGRPSTGPG